MGNNKSKENTPTETLFRLKYSIPDTMTVRQFPAGGRDINVTKTDTANGIEVLFMRKWGTMYSQLNDEDFYIARVTPNGTGNIAGFILNIIKAFKTSKQTLYATLPNEHLKLFRKKITFIGTNGEIWENPSVKLITTGYPNSVQRIPKPPPGKARALRLVRRSARTLDTDAYAVALKM